MKALSMFCDGLSLPSAAVVDLNGRYFGGRVVKACFYNLDKFRVLDLGEQVWRRSGRESTPHLYIINLFFIFPNQQWRVYVVTSPSKIVFVFFSCDEKYIYVKIKGLNALVCFLKVGFPNDLEQICQTFIIGVRMSILHPSWHVSFCYKYNKTELNPNPAHILLRCSSSSWRSLVFFEFCLT